MKRRFNFSNYVLFYQIILLFLITIIFGQAFLWIYVAIIPEESSTSSVPYFNQITEGSAIISPLTEPADSWKELDSNDGRLFIFSAYVDQRKSFNFIRVMSVALTKRKKSLFCHLKNKDDWITVPASRTICPEHWTMNYSSYIVDCPIPPQINVSQPLRITLSEHNSLVLSDKFQESFVNVHNNTISGIRHSFAVCVKPIHYNYDRAVWLVEFIEFYRILGVDHFYLYNHTVGPNVQRVLTAYQLLGLVTVLPWSIDIKSQKEIRTEAMFSALNDCLYRTMFLYKYSIMVDFDEYIVPHKHNTYLEMMKVYERKVNAGSFIFRNAFFYLYWENDTSFMKSFEEEIQLQVPYLVTLFKTRRQKFPHNHGTRSKYIVKPEMAVIVGNHVVWKHLDGKQSVHVPMEIGLTHHYRICEFGGYSCVNTTSQIDRTTWNYSKKLILNILNACQIFFPQNGQCPEAPPLGSPW